MAKIVQTVTLLKSHGWDEVGMTNKIASYERAGWKISDIVYDDKGQVTFKAEIK